MYLSKIDDPGYKTKKKAYRASSKICKICALRATCLGKVNEKKFSVTYYREEYERNIERVNSKECRYMKGKRQSTVEPVFGTLTPVHGAAKKKYHRARTGQQGDAPLRHCLQPEEVPEIQTKTIEKRGGGTCFGNIGEKNLSIAIWRLHKASKINLQLLDRQEKGPVKGLILNRYLGDQRLVQRLLLLATVLSVYAQIDTDKFRRT